MNIEQANAIAAETRRRFVWESDGKLDSFHILSSEGPIRGDCDDYAMTVLAELTGRSTLRFLWWLVTFKAVPWFVKSPKDNLHLTLWVRGVGYTDNWKNRFTETEDLHRKLFPCPWPWVLIKLLIGKWDKT